MTAACILGAFYYWKSSQTSKDQDAEKEKESDRTSKSNYSEVPGYEAPHGDDVSEENLVA